MKALVLFKLIAYYLLQYKIMGYKTYYFGFNFQFCIPFSGVQNVKWSLIGPLPTRLQAAIWRE